MKPAAVIVTQIESVRRNLSQILRAYGIEVKDSESAGARVNYAFVVLGAHDPAPDLEKFSKAKTILCAPIYRRESLDIRNSPFVKMVYYHELLDCDSLETQVGYANWMLSSAKTHGAINLPKQDFQIYPVEVPDLCQALTRASLSYFDNQSLFIAASVSFYGFADWIRLAWPEAQVAVDAGFSLDPVQVDISGLETLTPALSAAKLQNLILNSRLATDSNKIKIIEEEPASRGPKLNFRVSFSKPKIPSIQIPKKKLALALSMAVLILAMPLLLAGASLGALLLGEATTSKTMFAISKYTGRLAAKFIPPGKLDDTLSLVVDSSELSGRVLGAASEEKVGALDYESVYVASSFLEAKAKSLDIFLKDKILSLSVYKIPRDDVLRRAEIERYLPRISGADREMTYLILFEDYGFSRPQGGKVVGAKLFSLYKGELTENASYSAEQIQALLAGQVDPPAPMKDYTGVENWEFSQLQWATDFPAVAERAEWFASLALDRQVDGVFSVDNSVLVSLESEARDFNPISQLDSLVYYLDQGRLKIYFNDPYLQSFSESQGWAGEPSTFGNYLYVYDSQLSEEDSTVSREASLDIARENNETFYKLVLKFDNKSDHKYETYVRLVVSPASHFSTGIETLSLGGKLEGGYYLEVDAGEAQSVEFAWVNDKALPITIGTQSGIDALPLTVNVDLTGEQSVAYNTVLEKNKLFTIE